MNLLSSLSSYSSSDDLMVHCIFFFSSLASGFPLSTQLLDFSVVYTPVELCGKTATEFTLNKVLRKQARGWNKFQTVRGCSPLEQLPHFLEHFLQDVGSVSDFV